jgi:hypothetical protein
MHIINKVLLGAIIFFALVFFVLGAGVLHKQNQFRTEINRLQASLNAVERQNQVLSHGEAGQPGIPQLATELDRITKGRGNVWYNVAPTQIDPASGSVTVTLETPLPHQLTPEKVVFAFGDREKGGGYLGEFRVSAAAEKEATLTPTGRLVTTELERLQNSPAPWTLYEVMPADSNSAGSENWVFKEIGEDELRAMLPEASLQEYLKDGKPADPNDPPERVEDGKYVRRLRDYLGEFHEYHRQRSIYLDRIAAQQKDNEYLGNQLSRAQETVTFRAAEIEDTKAKLARATAERDAVIAHRKDLESQLADVEASIQRLARENERLASELTRWQTEALNRVNQRTASARSAN